MTQPCTHHWIFLKVPCPGLARLTPWVPLKPNGLGAFAILGLPCRSHFTFWPWPCQGARGVQWSQLTALRWALQPWFHTGLWQTDPILILHPSLLAVIAWFVVYSLNVYEKINSLTANGLLIITKDPQRLGTRFSHTHLCNLEMPERGEGKLGGQPPVPNCQCPSACMHTHTPAQVTAAPDTFTGLFVSLPLMLSSLVRSQAWSHWWCERRAPMGSQHS